MIFNEMKQIYSLLEDDHSKEVFLNRVLYGITEDGTYIDNIISLYFKRMQRDFSKYTDIINMLRKQIGSRKVVIYGVGNCGFVTLALFTSALKDIEVVLCDSNASSGEFYGHKLVDIEELEKDYKDAVILVTPVDKGVKGEIITNLIRRGFDSA